MKRYLILALPLCLSINGADAKNGVVPVKTGPVIRGITLSGKTQPPGTRTTEKCTNFSKDANSDGVLEDASVQCDPNATTDKQGIKKTLKGLSVRFNAYCVIDAQKLTGRVIQSSMEDNKRHCTLSDMKAKDAVDDFSTAIWR